MNKLFQQTNKIGSPQNFNFMSEKPKISTMKKYYYEGNFTDSEEKEVNMRTISPAFTPNNHSPQKDTTNSEAKSPVKMVQKRKISNFNQPINESQNIFTTPQKPKKDILTKNSKLLDTATTLMSTPINFSKSKFPFNNCKF